MRFRTVAMITALATGLGQTGSAFVGHKGDERPFVAAGRAPRAHRDVTWTNPKTAPPGWRAMWDRDTDVPLRMWGPSISAPGTTATPALAQTAARRFLVDHLALLAPGASPTDFVLAVNVLDPSGHIRTVTFAQQARGLAVYGGSIALTFERDHLVMASSTALPNIAVTVPTAAAAPQAIANSAIAWLGQAGVTVAVTGRGARVIVPIVRPRGASGPSIEYRVAETVSVASTGEAGRWDVWLDAADARPIARRATLAFASGIVSFDTPDRYPAGGRSAKPAPNATHTIDGVQVTSAMDGTVTWASATTATVVPGLSGPLVAITNVAGALVTDSLMLAPGGTLTWSHADDAPTDAQLDAFVFASTAKQFAQTRLNPNLAFFDTQESVNVNENQTCNAFSTGDDIHFFQADTMCENTGRIADVVYHEFGHSVHYNSFIPGEGAFDTPLSEGLADTLAVSITGDHGMGRGFFYTDAPLRDLDPVGIEKKWPQDADGEPHDEGEIIGETLWDLRKALIAKLGAGPGFDQTLKIYYGVMQRAADIPSTYAAALVTDDDDGDLSNGTPNQCEIDAAFALHGLADPATSIGLVPPVRDGYNVMLTVSPPPIANCTPPTITTATLTWAVHGGTPADLALAGSGNSYAAQIPTQPDGTVVDYHVTVALSDGTTVVYPENPADPDYQMYVGAVVPIKCFDFEQGAADWTHGGSPTANDEWHAGPSLGLGGDPKTAHGGANVFGIDLGSDDGLYSANTKQWAQSPAIDVTGYTGVRLQYYRWLGVEDGAYDQATIFANGTSVWTNLASPGMPTVEVNHVDQEWRFHDIDLSAAAASGSVTLKFELDSDPGLEFGGWTLDDVCVVAVARTGATCGDGIVEAGETCDDGNTTSGDGCSATCQVETTQCAGSDCGSGGGGCCSTSGGPGGPIALSLATIGLVLRRRRRGHR